MSKFKDEFRRPVLFHNDHGPFYVIDAAVGVEAACRAFSDELGRTIGADEVEKQRVSFGFGRACDGYHPHANGARWQIEAGGQCAVLVYWNNTYD